jgi:serine phosphatase RsbU (regulator of sigma subunit)
MANVEQLKKENQNLHLAVNELMILNDLATAISSVQDVDDIIEQIVIKCIKHLNVEEGTVSLLDRTGDNQTFHTMVRHKDTTATSLPFRMDAGLKGYMLKHRKSFLSNDIQSDDRFRFLSDESYPFSSILCVPLIVKGDLIGYLAVFNKKSGVFSEDDRRLLSIISSQSAQIIENARLLEEEKHLLSLREELKMAHNIQNKLLPDSVPQTNGFDIEAINIPAKSVGGDYYDFIRKSNSQLAFCIGDITGKGMPAAMLMANLQATIRSQILVSDDYSLCLSRTNTLLFNSTEPTKFATLFFGVLDSDSSQLTYVNAGHDHPYLIRKNHEDIELEATGLLLAVVENAEYEVKQIDLLPGDMLLFFTDGITEAMNTQKQEYGLEKLRALADSLSSQTAENIASEILKDVNSHVSGAEQSDDITLIIVKCTDQ